MASEDSFQDMIGQSQPDDNSLRVEDSVVGENSLMDGKSEAMPDSENEAKSDRSGSDMKAGPNVKSDHGSLAEDNKDLLDSRTWKPWRSCVELYATSIGALDILEGRRVRPMGFRHNHDERPGHIAHEMTKDSRCTFEMQEAGLLHKMLSTMSYDFRSRLHHHRDAAALWKQLQMEFNDDASDFYPVSKDLGLEIHFMASAGHRPSEKSWLVSTGSSRHCCNDSAMMQKITKGAEEVFMSHGQLVTSNHFGVVDILVANGATTTVLNIKRVALVPPSVASVLSVGLLRSSGVFLDLEDELLMRRNALGHGDRIGELLWCDSSLYLKTVKG